MAVSLEEKRDIDAKSSTEIKHIDDASVDERHTWLQQYSLLAHKSPEDLEKLNKSVLSKLDWKFLPCITLMLLMK